MKITHALLLFAVLIFSAVAYPQDAPVSDKETQAGLATVEAAKVIDEGMPDKIRVVIPKLEEAAKTFRDLGKPDLENYCIFFIGNAHRALGDHKTALTYFLRTLPLAEKNKEDVDGYFATHSLIATTYLELGEKQKAADHFEKVLAVVRQSKLPEVLGPTLMTLGIFYYDIHQPERAVPLLTEAVPLFEAIGNKKAVIAIHKGLADAQRELGQNELALRTYEKLLEMNKTAAPADKITEGAVYSNMSVLYDRMGEAEAALSHARIALSMLTDRPDDRRSRAVLLNNLGGMYSERGQTSEARQAFTEALAILEQLGDDEAIGAATSNMAGLISRLGDKQKALEMHRRALDLRRRGGDRAGIGLGLHALGIAYIDLGDGKNAKEMFVRALPMVRATRDRETESFDLANLGIAYLGSNRRLAVLFEKMSVNANQELRRDIRGLAPEIQRSFLRRTQPPFRALADMLIRQDRVAETFDAVDVVRDQQDVDIAASEGRLARTVAFTTREERFRRLYDDAVNKAADSISVLDEFVRRLGKDEPTAVDMEKRLELEARVKAAETEFAELLKRAETEFAAAPDKDDAPPPVPALVALQDAMRQMNASGERVAAVYTFLSVDRFFELVITADKVRKTERPVAGADLDARTREFVDALKAVDADGRPKVDVTADAKYLYDVVYRPVEEVLPPGTTTVLWSLDGDLRYLPIAALHDGTDFLIRRKINNVVFTRSDPERFLRPLHPKWTVTAFAGFAARRGVANLGASYDFDELVAAATEVDGIVRHEKAPGGLLDGRVLADKDFTADAMMTALKQRSPVVHISSHFVLRAGDPARSFLLLGDGKPMTLADMRRDPDLFSNVDLLTLSACSTGIEERDAEGREVDGFAELAQRLGAASVLATLWSVNECSTADFMLSFYRGKVEGRMSKAEALRRAQLALLDGTTKPPTSPCRRPSRKGDDAVIAPKSTRTFKPYKIDPARPYAHPYYWSPFVLYGNWK